MRSIVHRAGRRLARVFNNASRVKYPIIVYQMGKVGSSSLYESLRALDLPVPVYHCHLLNRLDEIEQEVRAAYPNPRQTLVEIEKGRRLRQEVDSGRWPHWNLISMTRAPVQRNISAFFESLAELVPDAYQRYTQGQLDMAELSRIFVERYKNNAPEDWFDSQMKSVFGLDVFAQPFPTGDGYAIYENERARLLVIRLEDLNRCAPAALKAFLGLRRFELAHVNAAADKDYNSMYRDFSQQIILPPAYLRAMHTSRFAAHFYRPEELAAFERRWSAERAPLP